MKKGELHSHGAAPDVSLKTPGTRPFEIWQPRYHSLDLVRGLLGVDEGLVAGALAVLCALLDDDKVVHVDDGPSVLDHIDPVLECDAETVGVSCGRQGF